MASAVLQTTTFETACCTRWSYAQPQLSGKPQMQGSPMMHICCTRRVRRTIFAQPQSSESPHHAWHAAPTVQVHALSCAGSTDTSTKLKGWRNAGNGGTCDRQRGESHGHHRGWPDHAGPGARAAQPAAADDLPPGRPCPQGPGLHRGQKAQGRHLPMRSRACLDVFTVPRPVLLMRWPM